MSSGRYHHDYYGKRRRIESEPRFPGHYQNNNLPPGRWGKRPRPEFAPQCRRRYSNGNASTGSRGSAASQENRSSNNACGNNNRRNEFPVRIHPKLAGRFVPPPRPKVENKEQQPNPSLSWQLLEPAQVATTPDLTDASPASEPSFGECPIATASSSMNHPPTLVQVLQTKEVAPEDTRKEGSEQSTVEERMSVEEPVQLQNETRYKKDDEQKRDSKQTIPSAASNEPTLSVEKIEGNDVETHDIELSKIAQEDSSLCVLGQQRMSSTIAQNASMDLKDKVSSTIAQNASMDLKDKVSCVKIPRKVRSSPTAFPPLNQCEIRNSMVTEEKKMIDTPNEQVPLQSATVPRKVRPVNRGVLEQIRVGSRVAVYWDGENEYFKGTVTKQRNAPKSFYLEYDDGDREWIDFSKHLFKVLDDDADNARPGGKTKGSKTCITQKECKVEEFTVECVEESLRSNAGESCHPTAVSQVKVRCSSWEISDSGHNAAVEDWVAAGVKVCDNDSSDSETDEEELSEWASTMLGAPRRPPAARKIAPTTSCPPAKFEFDPSIPVNIPISEKVKLRRKSDTNTTEIPRLKLKIEKPRKKSPEDIERGQRQKEEEEAKKRKESARWLTEEQIRTFLGDEECPGDEPTHWVRRSMRQPSKNILQSPLVKCLIEKLRSNDPDMVVLKLKKYLADPATPCLVIDAALDALEENTNCEALFIQNFNVGMRDAQVLRLLEILKKPSCKIWCLNIGETYNVRMKTWKKFARGLRDTKITHTYLSEHTITTELKDKIREIIRENRKKHNMHCDPDNLDTIVRCTHCWWNPINTKSLRPYLRKRGLEHMLNDKELQGLKGSSNGANIK